MDDHERLHENEIPIDDALVRRLVDSQFPQWGSLPMKRIHSTGTVNAIYRLGDDLALRLPRATIFADDVESAEAGRGWLDWARSHLPLRIPEVLAIGEAAEGYPCPWQVHRWIEGENLGVVDLSDSEECAQELGAFVNALRTLPMVEGKARRSVKAIGRSAYDPYFREALSALSDTIDACTVLRAWEATMDAPPWNKAHVWVHGDLLPDNLLATHQVLSAAIDFECYGTGDPALDLTAAWTVFSPRARAAFRSAVEPDEATWERARNHALRFVKGVDYYKHTNPKFARMCLRTVTEAVADAPVNR